MGGGWDIMIIVMKLCHDMCACTILTSYLSFLEK